MTVLINESALKHKDITKEDILQALALPLADRLVRALAVINGQEGLPTRPNLRRVRPIVQDISHWGTMWNYDIP